MLDGLSETTLLRIAIGVAALVLFGLLQAPELWLGR